ncbi:hypothetical protein [Microlunatus parietis]|uniref:Uncharacterized protein n=1 Tax=Microlunatus parietis TaxID=682979 RepID=A0A7Y9L7E4_9ACTN|nr:hypothetical protein [Microlunatus parietis]NYE69689.1 hypothetical protein [Microlunatus parietis]
MSSVQAWILERPKRILVISVIAIGFGVLAVLAAFMAIAALVELSDYQRTQLPFDYALTLSLTVLTLVESVIMIVCGVAIRSGHRWARLGLSVVCALGSAGSILQIVLGGDIVVAVISVCMYILLLILLWSRVTSSWFADVNS